MAFVIDLYMNKLHCLSSHLFAPWLENSDTYTEYTEFVGILSLLAFVPFFSSPGRGVVQHLSSVVRRVSSVSTITTRNN